MGKVLKIARNWLVSGMLWAGLLWLVWWLIDGQIDRLFIWGAPFDWAAPVVLGGALLLVAWSALPKWRRLETPEAVVWSPNLPARIGIFLQALFSPLFFTPSPGLIPGWLASHDYLRLAGLAVVWAFALVVIWKGLVEAVAEGISVKVSAAGLQVRRESFPWSDIQVIESGYAEFEGGAAVVLADRTIKLTPDNHGPTGRALVGAVQRFSPGTTIREPEFQAAFGAA